MSSGYSQKDEFNDGSWRGNRPSGNRGRGGRDSGQSYGGRTESSEDGWNQHGDKSTSHHDDSEVSLVSRGRGYRRSEDSGYSYQRQDQSYEVGDHRGESRGRGFSLREKIVDDGEGDLEGLSGWDDGSDSRDRRKDYSKGISNRDGDIIKDEQGWESGFDRLNIRDSGSSRGRGYSRPNRDEKSNYGRPSGQGDGWDDNRKRNFEDRDQRHGGGRGGSRVFRSSRNDDDAVSGSRGYGAYDDNEGENKDGEGNRFNRRYDGEGRRGRGDRGGRGHHFSSRGNDDGGFSRGGGGWVGEEGDKPRGRDGDRFTRRDDGDGRRGHGGRGGVHGFNSRGNEEDGHKDNADGEGEDKPRERYIPPAPTDDEGTVFGSSISSGNNFSNYDNIPVKVSGENVPKPINDFDDCNFQGLLIDNIQKSGYTKPTPVQKHAIPAIASGRDVMGCAQTGSGKTAAFLLPIIHVLLKDKRDLVISQWVEPQVIICSPTRELALQIFHEARKFAFGSIIKVAIAYGGTAVFYQASQIAKGCHILVATPGRLNDFVNRDKIRFSSCRFFVLDEADRMLDMGFLPAIETMLDHETMTPKGQRQTLMFSATFPDDIQRLAANYLHEYLFLAVGIVGGACADVEQNFHLVTRFEKKDKLIEILSEAKEKELTLVFVEKQRTADFIAAFLSENNFPTTSIHGARLQSQRELALADFKSGRMPTLVATAVAARGLDIKNVTHVVNFDMPSSVEEYVHRIGRTGRVGNRGKATSFYDPDVDGNLVKGLIRILEQTEQVIPTFFEGANDQPNVHGGRRSQNFGGQDVRGGGDVYNSGPTVVHEELEEAW